MKQIDPRIVKSVVAWFAIVVVLLVSIFWVTKDITSIEITGAAARESELLKVEGLGSILDGWTFENNLVGTDDSRVGAILEAHGAKEAESGVAPDILIDSVIRDNAKILWFRYRGQDRYIRKSDQSFSSQFTKILVDMARLRLTEFREEIRQKESR